MFRTILAVVQISLSLVFAAEAQTHVWIEPSLPALPPARGDASMTYNGGTNSIVLFGGSINGGSVYLDDTWIFTRAAGWLQASSPTSPSARSGSGLAYDPVLKRVVLFGGRLMNDTWTWDGSMWTQQFPAVSPPARGFNEQQMVFDAATGTVLLFGG